jgi:hypothetical protein
LHNCLDAPQGTPKKSRNLKKVLDKPHTMWYNKGVKREWKPSLQRLENKPQSDEENSQKS